MQDDEAPEPSPPASNQSPEASAIFIVHGRNNERKETVARFVRNLTDAEPIILHEQISGGGTLIEKLEREASKAGFAIVLATGDDIGREATTGTDRPRAAERDFRVGYFFGLLGREKVPSDLGGLVYVEVDRRGAWKIELTREIEATGCEIDR